VKVRHVVFFNFSKDSAGLRWELCKELLRSIGRDDLAGTRGPSFCGYVLRFWDDDPNLIVLRDGLGLLKAEQDFGWHQRCEHLYTEKELRSFRLLVVAVCTEPVDRGPLPDRAQFDFSSACQRCGTGTVQTSPLRIPKSRLPRQAKMCKTDGGQYLVSSMLANALREAAFTGIQLRQVEGDRKGESLDWHEIIAAHELPAMAAETSGLLHERSCAECRRDGFFCKLEEPLEPVYSSTDVDVATLPDFAVTRERFGWSHIEPDFGESWFAPPRLVVSSRVFTLLRQQGVRKVDYLPVSIK
jgi:hypothetical protein